jgi:hypothetical protein
MHELFLNTNKMEPFVAACEDENGVLKGVLLAVILSEYKGLKGIISKRAVVYGGPLVYEGLSKGNEATDEEKEVVDLLLKSLTKAVSRKTIFIQFRNFFDQTRYVGIFEKYGFKLHDRLNLLVDTGNQDLVKKNMSDSRWRQIKQGLRNGAVIEKPKSLEEVKTFYNILFRLYKYKVRKPLPGWSFFAQFYNLSKKEEGGVILLVKYDGKVIGGILSPVTPTKVIYEWYVCGLDKEYKEQHPSVVATWAAIDYAIKNNIPQFDFMGVGLPDKPYGVREFKKRFGGELVNYGRFSRINNRLLYHIAEVGYNVLAGLRRI